jgi:hypothetical protein
VLDVLPDRVVAVRLRQSGAVMTVVTQRCAAGDNQLAPAD